MKIAVICNRKGTVSAQMPPDYYSEYDSMETINAIAQTLRELGHAVTVWEADAQLPQRLQQVTVDLVFNIAEGRGADREAQVPALLDFLRIPYVGSGTMTQALSLHKAMSKRLFHQQGIPTPRFQLIHKPDEPLTKDLRFPLMVKPNAEGSAKGIGRGNVVDNATAARQQIISIITTYRQPALVEEFISGREITVGILGNAHPVVLPVLEIDFSDCRLSGEYFYSWRVKEYQGDVAQHLSPSFYCPARITAAERRAIVQTALSSYHLLECRDFGRVDIRLQEGTNIPYVLEVNTLPGLDPHASNLTMMGKAAGMSYADLLAAIVSYARERYRLTGTYQYQETV